MEEKDILSSNLPIIMDCCQLRKHTSYPQACSTEAVYFEPITLKHNLLDCLIQSMLGR